MRPLLAMALVVVLALTCLWSARVNAQVDTEKGIPHSVIAPGALVLDHDMLTSMIRTREPDVRIGYTANRIEIRTRRSALVGWLDVLLTARFERDAKKHIRLVARSLRAGPINQTGKRLEQARAGLLKLVDVATPATRVEIYRAGRLVYSQEVP